ncbi:MAG: hypothetical protein HY744_30255 [Deltaproteobacteria bacterium]|nr:hypothetical protein [Deltaproteobacteria bacterium]
MNNRFHILAAALSGAVVLVSAYACGGDDEKPAATTTTTTSSSSSGTGGGGGGCTPPTIEDCATACKELYKCTQEEGLCPGLKGTSEDDFVNGKETGGCLKGCEGMKALIALVDPCDCPGTMSTLTGANKDLKCSCEDTCGGGGGGAGPGGGGPGGEGPGGAGPGGADSGGSGGK